QRSGARLSLPLHRAVAYGRDRGGQSKLERAEVLSGGDGDESSAAAAVKERRVAAGSIGGGEEVRPGRDDDAERAAGIGRSLRDRLERGVVDDDVDVRQRREGRL